MKLKSDAALSDDEKQYVELRVPTSTILKLIITLIICSVIYLLGPFLMLIFMSVLLAVTFEPVADRLSKVVGRTFAVVLIAAGIGLAIGAIGFLVVPIVIEQAITVFDQFPDLANRLAEYFPPLSRTIRHLPQKIAQGDTETVTPLLAYLATFGGLAVSGLSAVALIYVFTIYLLFDGARTYAWTVAFFKFKSRRKIEETCTGIAPVISAYVIGQIVTSGLCALFTYTTLTFLGVPGAAMLAVLAAIFDILPIVGFFLFTIPSALFALSVSPTTALAVVGLFFIYHLIEAYVIVPFVYGNRLRVSGVVVLFSLLAGAIVGGIAGAIAILPLVASYPVIERIWLKDFLGKGVIEKHAVINDAPEGDQTVPDQ